MEIEGKIISLAEAARLVGISRSAMHLRMKTGLRGKDLIAGKRPRTGRKPKYEYNGVKMTIKQISSITGIPFNSLVRRISAEKMSVEQAVKHKPRRARIFVFGEDLSFQEVAKKFLIPLRVARDLPRTTEAFEAFISEYRLTKLILVGGKLQKLSSFLRASKIPREFALECRSRGLAGDAIVLEWKIQKGASKSNLPLEEGPVTGASERELNLHEKVQLCVDRGLSSVIQLAVALRISVKGFEVERKTEFARLPALKKKRLEMILDTILQNNAKGDKGRSSLKNKRAR